jgi:hypothetical protein
VAEARERDELHAIVRGVNLGTLSLAQVGGFSPDELEAAHGAASQYLTRGQPGKAMKIAGLLIVLEPMVARHHRLAGLSAMYAKDPTHAESFFRTAAHLDPTDALTLLYWGETCAALHKVPRARELLLRGLELADSSLAPHVQRAKTLLLRISDDGKKGSK